MGPAAGVAGLRYAVGFYGHGFKLDIAAYRLERFADGQELRGGGTRVPA